MKLNEIAEACNVSVGTVSKAINNKKGVGAKTRKEILEFINSLDNGITKKSSKIIAIILPSLLNPFFSLLLQETLKVAENENIDILVFDVDNNINKEMKVIKNLRNKKIDGFILISSSINSNRLELKKLLFDTPLPFILVDQKIGSSNFDAVYLDNIKGTFTLTEHLINNGKKDIIIISGDEDYSSSVERVEGYKEALYFNNIKVDDNKIIYSDFKDIDVIEEKLTTLFSSPTYPSTIICCNNLILQLVIKFMSINNLELNKDIDVVCFDNTSFLECLGMKITCVSPNIKELARESINLLLENIVSKKNTTSQINIVPELIIK